MVIFFLLHGDFCFIVVWKKQDLMFEGWLSDKTVVLWNKIQSKYLVILNIKEKVIL